MGQRGAAGLALLLRRAHPCVPVATAGAYKTTASDSPSQLQAFNAPFYGSFYHMSSAAPFTAASHNGVLQHLARCFTTSCSHGVDLTELVSGELGALAFDRKVAMTPSETVAQLDKFIVGQSEAKRAVAIALRNRWRRHQVSSPMKEEIMPKNILMIGPTGCGKTEIARRLAKLLDAPFVKVEATKFTELGYVGRDVDDIVKDLVENSVLLTKQRMRQRLQEHVNKLVEERILRAVCGEAADQVTIDSFRQPYRDGDLDKNEVEIEFPVDTGPKLQLEPGGGQGQLVYRIDRSLGSKRADKRKLKVGEARRELESQEAEKALSGEQVEREAIRSAEQDGIVFIDEIDKIVEGGRGYSTGGSTVSSEGVQRDLLPILEGSSVTTKYGNVKTDHVLFICSGAFHSSKPSDMLAELQGRLPIRVELKGLHQRDFYRILTEPQNNMLMQQKLMMDTEGVELQITDNAVRAMARIAEEANRLLDNIGARRLYTVIERVMADISFNASELAAEAVAAGKMRPVVVVDEDYVARQLGDLLKKQDLSKYVL